MKKVILLLLFCLPFWASAQPYVTNKKKVSELHRQLMKSTSDTARVNIYIRLCENIELRQRDSLLHYSSEALALSKKIGYKNGEGKGHLMYAIALRGIGYYGERGAKDIILSHLEKALEIFKKTGDQFELAETYRQISRTHYQLNGDYIMGYKCNMAALEIYERLGKKREMSYIYEDLSTLYSNADEIKEQLYYLNKSLALSIELNDSTAIGDKKGYIGICLKDSGKYEQALKSSFEALKIFEQMGSNSPDYGVPWTKGCIGDVYVLQAKDYISEKNIPAAKAKLESALKLFGERFDAETAGKMSHRETYQQLGECHLLLSELSTGTEHRKHLSESLRYYTASAKMLKNTHYEWMSATAYLGLSKGYEALGDFKSAYENQKLYVLYRNKNEAQRKDSELLKLKMQQVFASEKEKVKAEQDRKDAEAKRAKTQQLWIILALAVITLAILVIAFILFRNNKQKQKANQLLQDEKEKVESALGELKATQQQLIQSEKMASLGELTAGIAHEIQNPLNFVNNFSEVSNELIGEVEDEIRKPADARDEGLISDILGDIKQNLEKINDHGKRADAIVKGMLQHSRKSSGQKEPTDLNALADEYLRLAYHGLRAKDKSFNVELVTDYDPSVGKINVVAQDIGRVILNLITNAFHAANEKKKSGIEDYKPTVSVATKKSGKQVLISVTDNGNGIPEANREKIFQPFFTTKPAGEGTGLGLSLSYDIITKGHGGTLKVESQPGQYTTFTISLNA